MAQLGDTIIKGDLNVLGNISTNGTLTAASDSYTKTEIDTKLNAKANSSDVYTKTEIDTKLNTKTETDTELNTNNDFKNAGTHNSLYRGKDITNLFYDGTLSQQIAAETFDDIYIGDYIIGKVSGRKYLVADINYRLHCGDTECTTPHVLMIPEKIMGTAEMNSGNSAGGAYVGSEMYRYKLDPFKTIIKNDFGAGHILKHRNIFAYTIGDEYEEYESAGKWYDSEIELMNECMVYGSNIFHNIKHGNNVPYNCTIDKSQLSLFRLDKSKIVARNDNNERARYWLRDVVSHITFSSVSSYGVASYGYASDANGVRPAFLIY